AEVRPEPRAPAPTKSAPREEREPAEPTAPARAPEAEADPEAPPAPVTVARADLPAGDSRRVVPTPERMRIRMGNLIRRRRHARPRILETLLLSREDGSATAYVLYQPELRADFLRSMTPGRDQNARQGGCRVCDDNDHQPV